MTQLNLTIPSGFYEGEERCGHYITPKMKKVWAVLLDLLNELMTVLNEHGIQYHVFAGTMHGYGSIEHN